VRKPLIAGNWKMYQTTGQAVALVERLRALLAEIAGVDVVVCPPFTAMQAVAEALKGSRIGLGAQNMHWEGEGAYTGEVSPVMLTDLGCRYVILGHSERRQHFGETDLNVNRKVRAALRHHLAPILCVGETFGEREEGRTFPVVEGQLRGGLSDIPRRRGKGSSWRMSRSGRSEPGTPPPRNRRQRFTPLSGSSWGSSGGRQRAGQSESSMGGASNPIISMR